MQKEDDKKGIRNELESETISGYKLRNGKVQEKYTEKISKELEKLKDLNDMDVEDL